MCWRAETGTYRQREPRRNGYARAVVPSAWAARHLFSCNTYLFLREAAQKRVRQSPTRSLHIAVSQKWVRSMWRGWPRSDRWTCEEARVQSAYVSGIMRIPCAGRLARGRRVFHHFIRMHSILTATLWCAGIMFRVASPRGGRALGDTALPWAGQR